MRAPDRARSRRPGRWIVPGVVALLLAVLVGCAGGGAGPVAAPVRSTPPPAGQADRPVPTSVRAEAIDLGQDDLLRLGVAPDGTAEVPQDFGRIGWFDGAVGPTVLLGHVDSRDGPAAFYRLRDLRPGDTIEVGRSDGTLARYAVERTEQVAKDRFPTFAVFGASARDVLRLVTCAGEFDRGERSYTDNLVVHATRV